MEKLTKENIDFIIRDLTERGIVEEGIREEIVDHICSSVEAEMENGTRFIEAYRRVVRQFGHNRGLRTIQNQTLQSDNSVAMLRNYFKIGFRKLQKEAFYTSINVTGFAIGIAACLLIALFVADELSYDRWNVNADRIFRVNNEVKFGTNHVIGACSAAPVANAMQQDYPEIEATVRFLNFSPYQVRAEEGKENSTENNVIWTDSTFFKIFSVPVLEGNPATALKEPNAAAISQKTAEKYFPGKSALGGTLILDNRYYLKVTAIYENIPPASHFHFDIIVSFLGDYPPAKSSRSTAFFNENFNTYLLLRKGADPKALESKFPEFLKKYVGPQLTETLGNDFSFEKFWGSGNKFSLTLVPLSDIHLHSDIKGELERNGSIANIYLLLTIGGFILIIACINFINLSTARSGDRAREVGIRKVMGSLRSHLIKQFLTESVIITAFSFVVALSLAWLCLPIFNQLAQKQLSIPFDSPLLYMIFFAVALLIGLSAGAYPSFFLSAFKPVNVLKGRITHSNRGISIRSGLVVFQFAVSIGLIIGTFTVQKQISYIQNKKLGFQKEQVIIVKDAYSLRPNVQAFKEAGRNIHSVESATISGFTPVENPYASRSVSGFWREGLSPTSENLMHVQTWGVDHDYIKTFGLSIIDGRDFSLQYPADKFGIILNQAAVAQLNLGADPIGKRITTFAESRIPDAENTDTFTIIGVIEDFHFSSFREAIKPLALVLSNKSDGNVSFKFRPANTAELVRSLEKAWKEIGPSQQFQFSFLDKDFEVMFAEEQRLAKIFTIFSSLAIIIAGVGLFALSAFTAEQRTKEIGIRKVLGASMGSIILLLSRDLGKLILIAFIIAIPLSWYGVKEWLSGYAYKTEIGLSVFIGAGLFVIVVAWLTMSYQSLKAAAVNPVESLRNE